MLFEPPEAVKLEQCGLMFSFPFCRPSPEEAQLWSEAFDELLANKCKFVSKKSHLGTEGWRSLPVCRSWLPSVSALYLSCKEL